MYSLVMSPCSCDLIVTSLIVKLISVWFLDSELSTCFEGQEIVDVSPLFHHPFFHTPKELLTNEQSVIYIGIPLETNELKKLPHPLYKANSGISLYQLFHFS